MRLLKQSKHFSFTNRCLVEKLERETNTFRTNHYSTTRLDIPIYSNLSITAYKSHNVVTPMTRSNTRSLDATLLRRLHIAAFTLLMLLFSLKSTAQVDCPLCPTDGSRDTLKPHIQCFTVYKAYLDVTGYRYVSPLSPLTLLGDNCPVLTVWASQTRYYCRDIGTKNMIVFAQDSAGNIERCTTRITVIDTLRPTLTNCSRDTVFRLSGGECTSPVFNFPTPSVSDNCAGLATLTVTQKSGLPSGSRFPTGITTVSFEGADQNGNKTTCSFKVSVNDYVPTASSLLCTSSLDVGIGETCQTTLTSRDLLTGSNLRCLADYRLAITYNSTTLTNNLITSDYIGKTLRAQVTDLQTNNGCVAFLNIRDLTPPRIQAPVDVEVSCIQTNAAGSTPTSVTGEPRLLAECTATTTNYIDVTYDTPNCNGSFTVAPTGFPVALRFDTLKARNASRIVARRFTVRDFSGNIAETYQGIYVRKTDVALVTCPTNIAVQCSNGSLNIAPDSALINGVWLRGTGRPVFANGAAISNGGCRIATPFADVKTATATGYNVLRTWSITNTCTNEMRTCAQTITVTDQAPVLTCRNTYSAAIPRATGAAVIPATDLVASLSDDCTPLSNLTVRIKRTATGASGADSAQITFTCSDTGRTIIELIARDASGFTARCQAAIQVSDLNNVCRIPTQPAVFGVIETEERKRIAANVTLKSTTNPNIWQFQRTSNYTFLGMPRGDDCDLTPSRDSDLINGVTTFDVAVMSRHILDIQAITSPLKQIAADVNADGSVDALDMVITRRMVLRMIEAFPNNKSWRFIPKVYQFPTAAATVPIINYPEVLNFINLVDTVRSADFWAIKTADLNGSANGASVNGNGVAQVRGAANPLIINAQNVFLEKDKTYDVDITSDKLDVDGFQFTLNFDKNTIKILSIEQGELSHFNQDNYALFPSEGKATFSWHGSPDSKATPMNIFRLRLSAKQSGQLQDAVRLTSDLTPAEAFNLAGDTRSVALKFKGNAPNDFILFQNEPNPTANGATNIRFRLPEASDARLTLYDMTGKILTIQDAHFEKGDNKWHIQTPSVSGVILYRLDTPTHSATKRMIIGE